MVNFQRLLYKIPHNFFIRIPERTFFKKTTSAVLVFSLFAQNIGAAAAPLPADDGNPPQHAASLRSPVGGEDGDEKEGDAGDEESSLLGHSAPISPTTQAAWIDSLKFYAPYIASEVAVTANGIWNGYLYGRLGESALASEGVVLTWEFLVMGTAMGGMRAISILAGHERQEGLREDNLRKRRGLGNVNKTAVTLTSLYSGLAMLLFW